MSGKKSWKEESNERFKQVYLHWEITQEFFEEKVDYDYIHNHLINREVVKIFVISNDKETITEINYYKSMNGDLFSTPPITYKQSLNLIKEPKKITNE